MSSHNCLFSVFSYRLDGSSLKCNWVNDSPSSPVALIHPSGSMYVGGWADGKPTGFGIESSSDVGRYYGEFLNGARSGRGAFEVRVLKTLGSFELGFIFLEYFFVLLS